MIMTRHTHCAHQPSPLRLSCSTACCAYPLCVRARPLQFTHMCVCARPLQSTCVCLLAHFNSPACACLPNPIHPTRHLDQASATSDWHRKGAVYKSDQKVGKQKVDQECQLCVCNKAKVLHAVRRVIHIHPSLVYLSSASSSPPLLLTCCASYHSHQSLT